jgi:type II secretory pathway pseudopilin PulG
VTARKTNQRAAAFTLLEILVAMGIFTLFMGGLLATWITVTSSAVNTTAYARRQNDQMRVLDYVKRDIHRATSVEIYDGATLVTDATTFGNELRLTIPDYYADALEDDSAFGAKTTNQPNIVAGVVAYGAGFTVRYYSLGGAGVRNEGGAETAIADAAGAFMFSFKREPDGAIRTRVFYDQLMTGGGNRTLRRQVDALCVPRIALQ